MKLTIVPVTAENRAEAEKLEVFPEQKGFIETVAQCMQEADELSDWRPVCIVSDGVPVGFSMYGYIHEAHAHLWFDRLLIDRRYQKKGYGRQGALMILRSMMAQYPGEDVYLSVYDDNPVAIAMYRSFGFSFNGELDFHGEKVMTLKAGSKLPQA